MSVIDAQVHLNREIGLEASLTALDAVGIDAVLIDEWSGFDSNSMSKPYRLLPNGAFRSEYPMAREAVKLYPGRFAYMAKLDRNDPELTDLIADVAANPHQLCLRVSPKAALGQVEALANGEYDVMFRTAEKHGVPIMLWLPGDLPLVADVVREFPDLRVILDHCGILPLFAGRSVDGDFFFRDVAALAVFPNVYVKLSHAPTLSSEGFPFTDLIPHVRRLIDAFGEKRIMWASDHTQTKTHHSWAEALLYLQVPGVLSDSEREWIFSRTARTVLAWPESPSFGLYRRSTFKGVEPTGVPLSFWASRGTSTGTKEG